LYSELSYTKRKPWIESGVFFSNKNAATGKIAAFTII
jgi:hypothetical protein